MNTEERTEYIHKLETELQQDIFNQKIDAAKRANKESLLNIGIGVIKEQTRMNVLALFGGALK